MGDLTHLTIDHRRLEHELSQGGPGHGQEPRWSGRRNGRRPSIAEVTSPIDRCDLAEIVAAGEAIDLAPIDRDRNLAVEDDVEGPCVRPRSAAIRSMSMSTTA